MTKQRKLQKRRVKANAAKAPAWLQAGVSRAISRSAKQKYQDQKLGTFGPGSPVRRIDPAEYQQETVK